MSIDPSLPRKILIVHGVQHETDADLNQDVVIKKNIQSRLAGNDFAFDTQLYTYENLNDKCLSKLQTVISCFVQGFIVNKIVSTAVDLVGDVLINLTNGSTAQLIRNNLKEKLIENFEQQFPTYVLAHSLGTVYAFDVVNELMADSKYFNSTSRLDWPVQALVTIGSPLGISLFNNRKIQKLQNQDELFRWINIWDKTDPITSAHFFGISDDSYSLVGRYQVADSGWDIKDIPLDSGKQHLAAHTAYWDNAQLADDLTSLVTS